MTFAERLARLVAEEEENAKIEAIRIENWRANALLRAVAAMLSTTELLPHGATKEGTVTPTEVTDSRANKPFTVLTEHMMQPWSGYKDGRMFRCHMCGDFFKPGDTARLVWCNEIKEAIDAGVHCGNVLVCTYCDSPNIYLFLAEHERIGKTRYWNLIDPEYLPRNPHSPHTKADKP